MWAPFISTTSREKKKMEREKKKHFFFLPLRVSCFIFIFITLQNHLDHADLQAWSDFSREEESAHQAKGEKKNDASWF